MQHEMNAFLIDLFEGTAPHWFYLWTLRDKRSHWFTENSLDDYFTATTTGQIGDRDVYVGVALAPAAGSGSERVKSSEVAGLVGLWADIDYLDPVHAKPNLPKDAQHALRIMEDFPLHPTLVIQSGHGFQCWWLFQEPWVFESDEERQAGATLARRWHHSIRAVLSRHGCAMDSTFDLARVLRVPGTLNCKDPLNPQAVVLRTRRDERFNPSDFDAYLLDDIDQNRAEVKLDSVDFEMLERPPSYEDKYEALLENDANFADLYFHRKKLRGAANDQSCSSYDLALANIAVRVGWTDEEIVYLLMRHRKKHGEAFKHKGYYELTLGKARSAERFESQAERVAAAGMDGATPLDGLDTAEVYRAASDRLGFTVTELIEYVGTPPRYRLLCGPKEINLGGSDVWVNQTVFHKRVVEALGILPTQLKRNEWQTTVNMMMSVRTEVSQGEDMTEVGKAEDWIASYLLSRTPDLKGVQSAVVGKLPFYQDGALWLFANSFRLHLRDRLGERLSDADVAAMLAHIGAEPKKLKYSAKTASGRTTTEARRLPPERFPPERFISAEKWDEAQATMGATTRLLAAD